MLRTAQFACTLPKVEADALNLESGRIYTDTLVSHYRFYRKQGIWLKRENGERSRRCAWWSHPARMPTAAMRPSTRFYKACKTARACRQMGLEVKYPYKRKRWRTTIWKSTGITRKGTALLLSRARGLAPVSVFLPSNLLALPAVVCLEARLVWDRAARHYTWHLVVEDGSVPEQVPGTHTAAVDLGEIHPAAVTDGKETVIITCRARRREPAIYCQAPLPTPRQTSSQASGFTVLAQTATPQKPLSRQTKTPCP